MVLPRKDSQSNLQLIGLNIQRAHTRSIRETFCFRRRRLCLLIRREALLCSVELLNLWGPKSFPTKLAHPHLIRGTVEPWSHHNAHIPPEVDNRRGSGFLMGHFPPHSHPCTYESQVPPAGGVILI